MRCCVVLHTVWSNSFSPHPDVLFGCLLLLRGASVAGQKALSAAARGSDGRGPATQLLPALCDHAQVSSLADLVRLGTCPAHAVATQTNVTLP